MEDQLLEIQWGNSRALIDPAGSALVSLILRGKELIPRASEPRHPYHGVALAPWPNRIANGKYSFNGANYQLPLNEPFGNALHGFSFATVASAEAPSANSLVLTHSIAPRTDYPFSLSISLRFEISETELRVTTSATNTGEKSAPVGLGTHPFFVFDEKSELTVNAKTAAIHDSNMMPRAEVPAEEVGFKAGFARSINKLPLDVQFSQIDETCASLVTKDHGFEVFQQGANWLMIYTTEEFNWADGRTKAVAIEPQTCAADAFNSGEGLVILQPSERFEYLWGVRITN